MSIAKKPTLAQAPMASQMLRRRRAPAALGMPYRAAERDLQWFRAARFGLFVHWGPVSVSGCEMSWSRDGGRPYDVGAARDFNDEEQAFFKETGRVPQVRYDQLYREFNPDAFDADTWCRIARGAGMKYLVFTAKHHDGFANFHTRFSNYDIAAGPFRRDIVAELAQACRRHHLRFGIYYSQRDWYHPEYLVGDNQAYCRFMHGQIRELLSNYGRVDIIWFDSFGQSDLKQDWRICQLLEMMRQLQPGILVNNRLAVLDQYNQGPPEFWGDFDTPEQRVGHFQMHRPWESCISLTGRNWSWRPGATPMTLAQAIATLVRTVCADGNLLLNVGPMPSGLIEPGQVERLEQIGHWLTANGPAIYGTRGGPFHNAAWGGCTRRGNRLFVHVLHPPSTRRIALPLPRRLVKHCRSLDGVPVVCRNQDDDLLLDLPAAWPETPCWVCELELTRSAMELKPVDLSGRD